MTHLPGPQITGSGAVETVSLTKRYGHHPALTGVDLVVPVGSVFGVIGPNGAGKTTLMRLLLDIIRPSFGQVRVLGVDPRHGGAALRRQIGYLPGDLRLDGRMRGRDLINHLASISGPVASGTIDDLADRLGLDLDRQVRALSKGNRQKLGLVQALMHRPPLVVLDEPTAGLDPLMQQEVLTLVREARDAGQTVVLSSHVLSEIEQIADEVAILREGRVATVSTVATLRQSAVRHLRVGVASGDQDALAASLRRVPGLTDLVIGDADTPQGLRLVRGTLSGAVAPFVQAIAEHPVLDLVVEEPDLEEAVLGFYAREAHADSPEEAP